LSNFYYRGKAKHNNAEGSQIFTTGQALDFFIKYSTIILYEKRLQPTRHPSRNMKQNIHPKYYPNAQVKCACGNTFTVGSTKEFIEVEICSRCHPFYTGRERIIDTMGQVQKFRKRLAKKEELSKRRKK